MTDETEMRQRDRQKKIDRQIKEVKGTPTDIDIAYPAVKQKQKRHFLVEAEVEAEAIRYRMNRSRKRS